MSGIFFAAYAIVYCFPVSGFYANGETIFQTQQIGSNLLTGGDFGPEGGLVTTIMLLMAIGVLMMKWNKNT